MRYVTRGIYRRETVVVPTTRPYSSTLFVQTGGMSMLGGALLATLSLVSSGGTSSINGSFDAPADFVIEVNADSTLGGSLAAAPSAAGPQQTQITGSITGTLSLVTQAGGGSNINLSLIHI